MILKNGDTSGYEPNMDVEESGIMDTCFVDCDPTFIREMLRLNQEEGYWLLVETN